MKWNKYVSVILFGALIAVSLFLAFSCSNTASYAQHILFAMDTVIEIDLPVGSESSLFQQCEELIRSSEALFSKTTADSDVSHFNCEESRALISKETGSLIAEVFHGKREEPLTSPLNLCPHCGMLPEQRLECQTNRKSPTRSSQWDMKN